ncbi:MAG: hypothetical protein EP330_20635 [Deltaproteobacteria bacterium]|nr:MAG: hypothetical protein EP330_20635 [Deltaproteobacteria bacterium]
MGGNLTAGILDEASGDGRSDGVNGATRRLLEEQLIRELGKQLGDGLVAGATSEDEQRRLEATVDAVIAVAAARAGQGLRDDVGPELRAMVRRDLAQALAEGIREDVTGPVEDLVDKIVRRAALSAEQRLRDPAITVALADMLRDSVYLALREGRPGTPGVGETLHETLDMDVLAPVETSIGGLAAELADRVDESAQRTENVLKSVIGGLLVLLAGIGVLYIVNQQQLSRQRESARMAEREMHSFREALNLLDEETRQRVLSGQTKVEPRSSDYER